MSGTDISSQNMCTTAATLSEGPHALCGAHASHVNFVQTITCAAVWLNRAGQVTLSTGACWFCTMWVQHAAAAGCQQPARLAGGLSSINKTDDALKKTKREKKC